MTGKPSEQTGRRSIRLNGYDYTQAGGYYVTIVTQGRDCLFGEVESGEMRSNALGRIAQECWNEIPVHFLSVDVDAFVVMPNHVHGIIFIHKSEQGGASTRRVTDDIVNRHAKTHYAAEAHQIVKGRYVGVGAQHAAPLLGMTTNVKSGSLGAIVRSYKSAVTRRAGAELDSGNIWQRNYYEHIMRDQNDYERIAGYIFDNPLTWDQDEENLKRK